ncbi:MAG: inorganic pyrophosphatase [Candidatus Obscuribacter sp.]|nr:inorganic pyrophosphatase [Candidatus Obscuribacter sp.]MBP6591478.1 inorganic pyrophosphatase [Candidatus Obscuribacter sp.]MBP7575096.1 inorganic pyrophosphatase [Candidatus Obscuribacter sp.]MDQ5966345.1 Inorganic diphosphatase [Cyanobacteriota bacterium erpe_2018_sw_39hr_WHONDRS-SW48-000098_B_bin.30]
MVSKKLAQLLSMLPKSHPWHGVAPLISDTDMVRAYIEMVPGDRMKLELDKATGHLFVDRPQFYSSSCPDLYGFIPQTFCGKRVADRCAKQTKRRGIVGDGDPLDICVITDSVFSHGDLFVKARPIGGLRMIDKKEADDKIIAVLNQDITYGEIEDISQLPAAVITRLRHYFLSYKQSFAEGNKKPVVTIPEIYGAAEAREVIALSLADYKELYGTVAERLEELQQLFAQSNHG